MKTKHDWSRLDAMTEEQRHAAALADRDAEPLSDADMNRMRPTPRLKIIRRALGLTQEEFAARYQIPLGTLRDWEQGAKKPDQAARAYLRAIAGDPAGVLRALHAPVRQPG
jgi:putative transcriptional regulator